ncbi:hypothetical protein RJ55_03747 [Drechmeria coniospora]|nr:hypothetical protein RJ55_03747 [Drechmeria coniospora]
MGSDSAHSASDDVEAEVSTFDGNVRIIKSSTDWCGLSILQLRLGRAGNDGAEIPAVSCAKQISDLEQLPDYMQILPLPKVLDILTVVHAKIEIEVAQPLLRTDIPLEGQPT